MNKKIILIVTIIILSINSIAYQFHGFYNGTELYLNLNEDDISKLEYFYNNVIQPDTKKTFYNHTVYDISKINSNTFTLVFKNGESTDFKLYNDQILNTNTIKYNYRYNVSCENGNIIKFTVCNGPLREFVRYINNYYSPYCLKYFIGSYEYISDKTDVSSYGDINHDQNDVCITKTVYNRRISCNEKIKLEFDYKDANGNFHIISKSFSKSPVLSKIDPNDIKIEKINNKIKILIPKEYNGLIMKIIFVDSHGNEYNIVDPSFNNGELTVDLCKNKIDKSRFDIYFWNKETQTIFGENNLNLGECNNNQNNENKKKLKITKAEILHDSKYHLNVSWTSDCENFNVSYLKNGQWVRMCEIDGRANGKNGFSCDLTKNGNNYNVSIWNKTNLGDNLNYINKANVSCDSVSSVANVDHLNDNGDGNDNNQNNVQGSEHFCEQAENKNYKSKKVTVDICNNVNIEDSRGKITYKCNGYAPAVFVKGWMHRCHACGTPYTYFYNFGGITNVPDSSIYDGSDFFYKFDSYIGDKLSVGSDNSGCVKSWPSEVEINPSNNAVVEYLMNDKKNDLKMRLTEEFEGGYGTCGYVFDPGDNVYHFILDVAWKGTPTKNDGIAENCGSGQNIGGNVYYGIHVQKYFFYFDNGLKCYNTKTKSSCNLPRFDMTYKYNGKPINRAIFYNLSIDTSKAWTQPCLAPPINRNGINTMKSTDCDYSCSSSASAPNLYRISSIYGKKEKVSDGRKLNVYAGRNVVFKPDQPKYRTVILIFNITKDGKPVDTVTSYCVPTWSGNDCPYIYTRFDKPGDYTVKVDYYYAKTDPFSYTLKTFGKCSGTEKHTTNVCKTAEPIFYFLKQVFKIDDYENPFWQQLANFVKSTQKFYYNEMVPECIKICNENAFEYKKSVEEESVLFNVEKLKSMEFNVHAIDPGIEVDMSAPTNQPKDGQIIPIKFTVHIKNENIDPKTISLGYATMYPNSKGTSENNPKFLQEWIPYYGMLGVNINNRLENSEKCKNKLPDDKECYDVTYYTRMNSICRKGLEYNKDCLSACGENMEKCPITFVGSYFIIDAKDPNEFWPFSVSTDNSFPKKSYLTFFVQPQKYSPQKCMGASISSLKVKDPKIDFGGEEELDIKLDSPSQSGCFYTVVCEAKNETNERTYSRILRNSGKFGEDEIKLSGNFYKSGEWIVNCNLYSSKDGPYVDSSVLADQKNTTFEVGKMKIDSVSVSTNDVHVGGIASERATIYYQGEVLPSDNAHFNWSINCPFAEIIGKHEDYGLSSISVKGDMVGDCQGSVNVTVGTTKIKKDFSFKVLPSNVGVNGFAKALYIIPEKTVVPDSESIRVKAKITGYKDKDRYNKRVDIMDKTCHTDKYGVCYVNVNIPPREITGSSRIDRRTMLKGKFTVSDNWKKIYLTHGYNLFATTGGSSTTCKNYDIVSVDGKKPLGRMKDLNGIYWIYVHDNNCTISVDMKNSLEAPIHDNFYFYSPKEEEKISSSEFSEALEWGHASEKFIPTNDMHPGYVYVVMKK